MSSYNPGTIVSAQIYRAGATVSETRQIRIVEELGVGGMATVYQVDIDNEVLAMKVLHGAHTPNGLDTSLAKRFLEEMRVLTLIPRHENIATMFGSGEVEGWPMYLAEYLHGRALSDLLLDAAHEVGVTTEINGKFRALGLVDLKNEGRKIPKTAIHVVHIKTIMRGILKGLIHLHESGVVHRDLKPDNVMVMVADDQSAVEGVKILDFGIAKASKGPTQHTEMGDLLGTPEFMSPEQVLSSMSADSRSDIYAAGLILLLMMTGLRTTGLEEVYMSTLLQRSTESSEYQQLLDPGLYIVDYPPGLREVVLKATRYNPNERYANAREMLEALEAACEARNSQLHIAFAPTLSLSQRYLPDFGNMAEAVRRSIIQAGTMTKRAAVATVFWTRRVIIGSVIAAVFIAVIAAAGYFTYASSDPEVYDRTAKTVGDRVESIAASLQSVVPTEIPLLGIGGASRTKPDIQVPAEVKEAPAPVEMLKPMDATQKAILRASRRMDATRALKTLLEMEKNDTHDPALFNEIARRLDQNHRPDSARQYRARAASLTSQASQKEKVH